MARDFYDRDVTPGCYIHFDSGRIYCIYEKSGILMADDSNGRKCRLDELPLRLMSANPKNLIQDAKNKVQWIQDHFPETTQNPSISPPPQTP